MDLIGFTISQDDDVMKYIRKNYGEIPRLRGVRFMRLEECIQGKPNVDTSDLFPIDDMEEVDYTDVNELFDKYVGQDVIYIHTRCGNCGTDYNDKESNYAYYDANEWEEKNKELFLAHVTDPYDVTYCTHYFKAVIDDDYKTLMKEWGEEIA